MALLIICVVIIIAIIGLAVYFTMRTTRNSSRPSSSRTAEPAPRPQNRTSSGSRTNVTPVRTPVPNETEIMDYFANARHGQEDNWFRFRYKLVGNEWRAYILRMPSLNGRNSDCHSTHRYSDSNGNYWVCYNPQATNLKDCQSISKSWADRLLEYIATGVEANAQRW